MNQDAWASVGLAAVCLDGLGGHGDGEVASSVGAQAFAGAAARELAGLNPASDLFEAMRTALLAARAAARDGGPGNPVMSAAAVVAVIDQTRGKLHLAWAGDCRAYLWRHGARVPLRRVTEDHDEIYWQWLHDRCSDRKADQARWAVDNAQTAGDAFHMGGPLAKKAFRRRNAMHVELAIGDATVRTLDHDPDDIVLLTSDGVHGNLTRPELEQTIGEHLRTGSVQDLPEHLAHAAQVAGDEGTGRRHPDDITCVAITTRTTAHDPS